MWLRRVSRDSRVCIYIYIYIWNAEYCYGWHKVDCDPEIISKLTLKSIMNYSF